MNNNPKCPQCGRLTYLSIENKHICPSCGHGRSKMNHSQIPSIVSKNIDLRIIPYPKYARADYVYRTSYYLTNLMYPSYKDLESTWILNRLKELFSIKKQRSHIKHLARMMAHIEGFEKSRSTRAGIDLALLLKEEMAKLPGEGSSIFITTAGLFEANTTDNETKKCLERLNELMNRYPISDRFILSAKWGP